MKTFSVSSEPRLLHPHEHIAPIVFQIDYFRTTASITSVNPGVRSQCDFSKESYYTPCESTYGF